LSKNKTNPPQDKSITQDQTSKFYAISLFGLINQNLIFVYVQYYSILIGAGYTEQGLVTSMRNLGPSLTQSFWGQQSDKRGRRPLLIFGYVTLLITTLLFMVFTRINTFIVLLAIQGFCGFAVVQVVMNAMLGDVAQEYTRGKFIGKIISFGSFVSVPVILLFGYLLDRQNKTGPSQYYLAFLSASLFALLTLFLVISLKETLKTKPDSKLPSIWGIIKQHQKFRRFLTIDAIFTIIMAFTWPLFPFVIIDIVRATNTQISIIWASWMFTMALAQKYGGSLSDKIGRKPLLILCRTMLFVLPMSLALTNRWPTWILPLMAQIIAGFAWGVSVFLDQMVALDLAPADQKAVFTGTVFTITGIAGFIGSNISGVLTQILAIPLGQYPALFLMLWIAAVGRVISGFTHFFIDETAPSKRKKEHELFLWRRSRNKK